MRRNKPTTTSALDNEQRPKIKTKPVYELTLKMGQVNTTKSMTENTRATANILENPIEFIGFLKSERNTHAKLSGNNRKSYLFKAQEVDVGHGTKMLMQNP